MKRIIGKVVRRGWGLTESLRRPLGRKIDDRLARIVAARVREETHARLDLLLHVMNTARHEANAYRGDTNLALDALIREVSRLQFEVEALRDLAMDAAEHRSVLGVVDPGDTEAAA